MTWQEAIAVVVILSGLGAGAFLVAQRPAFWIEFGWRLTQKLWPSILGYVTKRMDPKTEAEWRKCMLRGGKWDYRKKRCDR